MRYAVVCPRGGVTPSNDWLFGVRRAEIDPGNLYRNLVGQRAAPAARRASISAAE
jgi:hypothetical protein